MDPPLNGGLHPSSWLPTRTEHARHSTCRSENLLWAGSISSRIPSTFLHDPSTRDTLLTRRWSAMRAGPVTPDIRFLRNPTTRRIRPARGTRDYQVSEFGRFPPASANPNDAELQSARSSQSEAALSASRKTRQSLRPRARNSRARRCRWVAGNKMRCLRKNYLRGSRVEGGVARLRHRNS